MKLAKLATLLLAPLFLASVAIAAPMTVSASSDNVTVVVNGKATALRAGAEIPVGATVKVAKGASARVTLPDGTVVGLGEGATFTLTSATEEDGITTTVAALSGGALTVQTNLKKGSVLEINTPSGTLSGNKGTATVSLTPSSMTVTATQGRWRVTGTNGKAVVVAGGQTVLLKKNNPSPAPRPATRREMANAESILAAGDEDYRDPATSLPMPEEDPFGDVEIEGSDINTFVNPEVPENSPTL